MIAKVFYHHEESRIKNQESIEKQNKTQSKPQFGK